MSESITFRFAVKEDIPLILGFIRELAEYENMSELVVADEVTLTDWLFSKRAAETLIAEADGEPAGFALFFSNFSTFLGRGGIYLEDLFVKPRFRGLGIGKGLMKKLASIAKERGCGRFEWWCLDWNKPSIDFYRSLGAKPMDEWTVYRVDGDALDELAL